MKKICVTLGCTLITGVSHAAVTAVTINQTVGFRDSAGAPMVDTYSAADVLVDNRVPGVGSPIFDVAELVTADASPNNTSLRGSFVDFRDNEIHILPFVSGRVLDTLKIEFTDIIITDPTMRLLDQSAIVRTTDSLFASNSEVFAITSFNETIDNQGRFVYDFTFEYQSSNSFPLTYGGAEPGDVFQLNFTAVPEPSSSALFLLAGGLLMLRRVRA